MTQTPYRFAAAAAFFALVSCSNETNPSSTDAPAAAAPPEARLTSALKRDEGFEARGFAFSGQVEVSVDAGPERFKITSDVDYRPAAGEPGLWRTSDRSVEVGGSKADDPNLQQKAAAVFQAVLSPDLAEIGGYDPDLTRLATNVAETPPGSGVFEFGLDVSAFPESAARDRFAETVLAATVKEGCVEGAASEYQTERAQDDPGPVLRRRVFSYACPADGPAFAIRSEITQIDRAADGELHTTRVTLTVDEASYALGSEDEPPAGR